MCWIYWHRLQIKWDYRKIVFVVSCLHTRCSQAVACILFHMFFRGVSFPALISFCFFCIYLRGGGQYWCDVCHCACTTQKAATVSCTCVRGASLQRRDASTVTETRQMLPSGMLLHSGLVDVLPLSAGPRSKQIIQHPEIYGNISTFLSWSAPGRNPKSQSDSISLQEHWIDNLSICLPCSFQSPSVIRIKSRRIGWAGNVARMGKEECI
jgi:hypothetical protein